MSCRTGRCRRTNGSVAALPLPFAAERRYRWADEELKMSIKVFGSCCSELKEAMTATPSSLFQVEADGVLYLTVGYVQTEKGISWFQHAALFCPFCGVK